MEVSTGPALAGTGSAASPRTVGGAPSEGMLVVLLAAGLVLVAVIAAAAVARRHAAGATVAGAVLLSFITSTAASFAGGLGGGDGARTVVLVLPLLVLVGVAAFAVPAARARLAAALPIGNARRIEAVSPATAVTVGGLALVVLVVHPLAVSTWNGRVLAVLAFVLLGAVGALALRRDGPSGRILAGAALVGLALTAPWGHLVHPGIGLLSVDPRDPGATAIHGLLVGGGAIAVLVLRHPHPGVVAAATLLGLRIAADLVGSLVLAGYGRTGPIDTGLEGGVLVMAFLPIGLALVGAALVAATGGRAAVGHAHAVGAVAALATVATAVQMSATSEVRSAIGVAVGPLAPTAGQAFTRIEFATTAIVVLVPVMLATIALAATAARRPSPAVAGGSAAALLAATVAIPTAADGAVDALVPIVVGILGVLLAGVALFAVATAPGVRDRR